jgi:hypothetical protein
MVGLKLPGMISFTVRLPFPLLHIEIDAVRDEKAVILEVLHHLETSLPLLAGFIPGMFNNSHSRLTR